MEKFIVIENGNREEWLSARRYGIGGSDASAIVGLKSCIKRRTQINVLNSIILIFSNESSVI